MVGTMAHEMDFANQLELYSKSGEWDETIEKAVLCRFMASRENADGLFVEFQEFLSEERAKEMELADYNPISGRADDDDDEEDDEEDEDEEDFEDEDEEDEELEEEFDEAFEDDDDLDDEDEEDDDDDDEEDEDDDDDSGGY